MIIKWSDKASKELKKLDYQIQKKILDYTKKFFPLHRRDEEDFLEPVFVGFLTTTCGISPPGMTIS